MKILLSAAETSSDIHAAELLKALLQMNPKLEFYGVGGPELRQQGLHPLVRSEKMLAMGFLEIFWKIPYFIFCLHRIVRWAKKEKPLCAIVLDYPDFHFSLAKRLKKLGIPVLYYIPPKVWAWRTGRIEKLKEYFYKILCILPFEISFYEKAKLPVHFVGHPLADEIPWELTKEQARKQLSLEPDEKVWACFPGSRPSEVKYFLEPMIRAFEQYASNPMTLAIPVPKTLEMQNIQKWKDSIQNKNLKIQFYTGRAHEILKAADHGILKSGTSTLEAALLGLPHTVIYGGPQISEWIFTYFVKYKGPIALSNLFYSGFSPEAERVFPEILGMKAIRTTLCSEIKRLETDQNLWNRQKKAMEQIQQRVKGQSPSKNAAGELLQTFHEIQRNRMEYRQLSLGTRAMNILVSWIWSLINWSMRWGVKTGFLRPLDLGTKVISVGNIQVGGAGKTPLVAQIAREGLARGLSVAILCRGYGSRWERKGGILSPFEDAPRADICGDEALLLHQEVPGAWIGVGKDRFSSYQKIRAQHLKHVDWVILDDGFQHWKLTKHLEILAVTSRKWGGVLFRDFTSQLQKAHLIVWTKGLERPPLPENIPWVRTSYELSDPTQFHFGNQKIWLVSGVGDPSYLESTVKSAGLEIFKHTFFPDHARYAQKFVEDLMETAKRNQVKIAITGKDWVKWQEWVSQKDLFILEPTLHFEKGKQHWENTFQF